MGALLDLGMLLLVLGLLGGLVWFLVVAFRTDPLWALGSLLLPFIGIIFLAKYPRKAWKPFALMVVCLAMQLVLLSLIAG